MDCLSASGGEHSLTLALVLVSRVLGAWAIRTAVQLIRPLGDTK